MSQEQPLHDKTNVLSKQNSNPQNITPLDLTSTSHPQSYQTPTPTSNNPNSADARAAAAAANLHSLGITAHDSYETLGYGSVPDRFILSRLRAAGDMNPFVLGDGGWKRPTLSRGRSSAFSYDYSKFYHNNNEGNKVEVEDDLWEYGH